MTTSFPDIRKVAEAVIKHLPGSNPSRLPDRGSYWCQNQNPKLVS